MLISPAVIQQLFQQMAASITCHFLTRLRGFCRWSIAGRPAGRVPPATPPETMVRLAIRVAAARVRLPAPDQVRVRVPVRTPTRVWARVYAAMARPDARVPAQVAPAPLFLARSQRSSSTSDESTITILIGAIRLDRLEFRGLCRLGVLVSVASIPPHESAASSKQLVRLPDSTIRASAGTAFTGLPSSTLYRASGAIHQHFNCSRSCISVSTLPPRGHWPQKSTGFPDFVTEIAHGR